MSEMISSTPRKRTISEANNDSAVNREERMIADLAFDGQSSGGLRRRRIGDSENDAEASNGVANETSNEMREESVASQLHQTSVPLSPPQRQYSSLSSCLPPEHQKPVLPLSMQLMRPFWLMSCCPDCGRNGNNNEDFFSGNTGLHPRNISMASMVGNSAENPPVVESQNGEEAAGEKNNGNGAMESFKKAASNNISAKKSSYLNNSPVSSQYSGLSVDSNSNNNNNKNNLQQEPKLPPQPPKMGMSLSTIGNTNVSIEQLLHEYTSATQIFGCSLNPGVLTTFRFSLPTLRVSGNFFDADMLALTEVLLKHCNGALSYIKRLDFTIAGKEGRDRGPGGGGGSGKKGIRSHGAYALSKVLSVSQHIEEVYLTGNRIGSYGSAAIFTSAASNSTLKTLLMRGCRIGERGALVFAKVVCEEESASGLREVDLTACRIGFRGCYAIEEALKGRMEREGSFENEVAKTMKPSIVVDMEGNMVFQEIMNCVTHGLGILLGTVGTYVLNKQISGLPSYYIISCAIYSVSLIVLYTSSTLFHSFFALQKTKFIFSVIDKCAIYLLIAGSYTPFLMIALHHEPKWSLNLLLFIWACAISGILVEAMAYEWKHRPKFSLAMYLGMGWSCMVCLPDLVEVMPPSALVLLVAGGVAYTGGVPFFVRNNNLDHSIWHLFVLAGSVFHWLCVFWYVAIPDHTLTIPK